MHTYACINVQENRMLEKIFCKKLKHKNNNHHPILCKSKYATRLKLLMFHLVTHNFMSFGLHPFGSHTWNDFNIYTWNHKYLKKSKSKEVRIV